MVIKIAAILLFFVFILSLRSNAFTQTKPFLNKPELQQFGFYNYENINPNLLAYPLERFQEGLNLFLTFNSTAKQQFIWKLYDRRFNELVYIINYNRTGFLLETVDRYNTYAGKIKTQNPNLDNLKKEQIKKNLKLLEKMRDRYHSGSAYWIKIQQAVDTTRSLI